MSVAPDMGLHLLDSSTADGRTGRLRPEGPRPTTHPRTSGLVGTVSRSRIARTVAPVDIPGLYPGPPRAAERRHLRHAHLTVNWRHIKHDLVGFGVPALSAEHEPVYSH